MGRSCTRINDMFNGCSFVLFTEADKFTELIRVGTFDICYLDEVFVVLNVFLKFILSVLGHHNI